MMRLLRSFKVINSKVTLAVCAAIDGNRDQSITIEDKIDLISVILSGKKREISKKKKNLNKHFKVFSGTWFSKE